MNIKNGLKIGLGAVLLHTSFVYTLRREETGKFRQGDADDILMDALKTGDIILFKRNPLLYYAPGALSIILYQIIHGSSDFDHCGVIVRNVEG